jgi:hypothetical protein
MQRYYYLRLIRPQQIVFFGACAIKSVLLCSSYAQNRSISMTRILLVLSIVFFSAGSQAQDVAIGGWKEHLSYKNAISVSEGNGRVYVATTSGIFSLNKADNSMDRLSKVTGLSDIEASVLNINTYNNKLLIAYKNSNIDIVSSDAITNIPDIKRKTIVGNKAINNIYFIQKYAYLACGFGIVVIDMDRLEVKDTYYIGPGGNAINVTDITSDGSSFYASTSSGIYTASVNNPNLANFTSWTKMPMAGVGFPNGYYNTIAAFNGKVYANYSKYIPNPTSANLNKDSLYEYNPATNTWLNYHPGTAETTYQLRNSNNQLVIVQEGLVSTSSLNYYSGYFSDYARPRSAVIDNSGTVWIADTKYGLVSWRASSGYSYIYPNGPASPKVYNMNISESKLLVAPGGKQSYFTDGIYRYAESEWKNIKGNYSGANLDTIYDYVDVLVDPNNSSRSFATSWDRGVIEFYNDVPVKVYNEANSSLLGLHLPGYNPIWVYGMAMDGNNNLWVTNSGVQYPLSVRNASGAWQRIKFSDVIGNFPYVGKIIIDKNDQKWIMLTTGGGLLVYKGGITADANSSNARKLTSAAGNGALPSADVYSIAEDKDGEIWVGTDKGIGVFYSPENVFSGGNFDAQQILIEQDGHIQILLETETVQAIAVDDANRKWIGTAKSGVFLMSPDGTQQIYHFDADNSPLLSNNVKNIAIDRLTGEIYFGTDKGIVSFRGTAVKGKECFEDVYSFPNPVKPDYTGPIAITGLMDETTVKITDISGTLVYEMKSEGGQAIWYGKNFKGEKVSTGVYMVFCTSEDASCQKVATKILFIN